MKNQGLILVMIGVSMLFFYNSGLTYDKELNFPLPELLPLITPNQCRCEAIVSTGLFADTTSLSPNIKKGISAGLNKGTDKISIQIDGDTLYFLSGASFETGEAKPAQFKIFHHSKEHLLAIISEETPAGGYTVDIFTLNKKTGLAVWTKTRSSELFRGNIPSAQTFYLKCR